MSARYSVVQYLPSPIADERINVGVITWDDADIYSRFLRTWGRVRSFSGADPKFLAQFAKQFQTLSSSQLRLALGDAAGLDTARLETMIGRWENSVRFTPPRGSLNDARTLLAEIAPTFLKEAAVRPKVQKPRNRRVAARLAASWLFDAVKERLADRADRVVAKNKVLTGQLESHTFDVVLANAKPFAAVQALSFEVDKGPELNRDVDAAAWILEDVSKKHPHMPIAMFLLPPSGISAPYERAKKLFPKLNGEIVTEQKMPQWARKQARAFAEEHA
jgi:hypothetical protein